MKEKGPTDSTYNPKALAKQISKKENHLACQFCSKKWMLDKNLAQQKILLKKYYYTFLFYFAKPINELLNNQSKPFVHMFKDQLYQDEEKAQIKKQIERNSDELSKIILKKCTESIGFPNLAIIEQRKIMMKRIQKIKKLGNKDEKKPAILVNNAQNSSESSKTIREDNNSKNISDKKIDNFENLGNVLNIFDAEKSISQEEKAHRIFDPVYSSDISLNNMENVLLNLSVEKTRLSIQNSALFEEKVWALLSKWNFQEQFGQMQCQNKEEIEKGILTYRENNVNIYNKEQNSFHLTQDVTSSSGKKNNQKKSSISEVPKIKKFEKIDKKKPIKRENNQIGQVKLDKSKIAQMKEFLLKYQHLNKNNINQQALSTRNSENQSKNLINAQKPMPVKKKINASSPKKKLTQKQQTIKKPLISIPKIKLNEKTYPAKLEIMSERQANTPKKIISFKKQSPQELEKIYNFKKKQVKNANKVDKQPNQQPNKKLIKSDFFLKVEDCKLAKKSPSIEIESKEKKPKVNLKLNLKDMNKWIGSKKTLIDNESRSKIFEKNENIELLAGSWTDRPIHNFMKSIEKIKSGNNWSKVLQIINSQKLEK